jgi:hypothetical protein
VSIVTASLLPEKPRRRHGEDDLQRTIVTFGRYGLPDDAMLWHPPNGGQRHSRAAARLVGLGVVAGIPDLILWHRGRTLGIEVKLPGAYPSAVQKQMHAKMERCEIPTVVVRSLDEFIDAVAEFGVRLTATTASRLQRPMRVGGAAQQGLGV